jgi:hypothetical protein
MAEEEEQIELDLDDSAEESFEVDEEKEGDIPLAAVRRRQF